MGTTEQTGWREITPDNLPELETPVWLWDGKHVWISGRTESDDGWIWGTCYESIYYNGTQWKAKIITDGYCRPTHWMPLPEPPK